MQMHTNTDTERCTDLGVGKLRGERGHTFIGRLQLVEFVAKGGYVLRRTLQRVFKVLVPRRQDVTEG